MDIHYLRKLLPNVDLMNLENHMIIKDSNIPQEQKFIMILLNHFDSQKTEYIDFHALETEAKYINKLFPKFTESYILEQLEIFKDMPQRVEIVLRIIVHSKIDKVNINKAPVHGIKRTSPTQFQHIPLDLNSYYQPIKMRKIGADGSRYSYGVDNNLMKTKTELDNSFFGSHSFNDPYTVVRNNENRLVSNIHYGPTVKSCTVTSVTAVPQVQNNLDIIDDSSIDMNIAKEVSNFIDAQNRLQNCDSSSHIKKPPLSSTYSVVSSSDEIFNFPKLEEGNVSTSEKQFDNVESAILQTNASTSHENTLPEQEVLESDVQLTDKSALSVAQNCTINSSNETTDDVINKSVYLDFFSEIEVGDASTIQVDLSDSTSQVNGVSHTVTAETKDEELIESIVPETSNKNQEIEEKLEDSDKTLILSPTSINELNNKDMPLLSDDTAEQEISINEDTKINDGQSVDGVPSTSKQENSMSEDFNLLRYLNEVTNAPLRIILKQCKKQGIKDYFKKPELRLLEVIVDNLLTNSVSSGSSTSDEDDPDAVKLVGEAEPQSTSTIPSCRMKSVKTNSHERKVVKVRKQQSKHEATEKPTSIDSTSSDAAKQSSNETNVAINTQLVNYLCGIFPDACPAYIRGLCKNKPMNDEVVDALTTKILSSDGQYPKRPVVQPPPDVFPENQLEILIEFLPDADPDYLRMMCDRFEGKPDLVKNFLNEAMERRDYPTRKDYLRRQQLSAQQKQYTTEFNVENFIKLIPDPHNFFSDSSRVIAMDHLSTHYALVFLRNAFSKLPVRLIQSTFTKNNCNLSKTYKDLESAMSQGHSLMKSTRKAIEMPNSIQNIPLLQEIAYNVHQKEIEHYLQEIKEKEEAERQEALSKGLMKSCNCCYDEEVLPKDIFTCESGCAFCKSCIVKSTEVRFGEGKLDFPCLMNCESQFSLQTLQAVLSPKLFSKIAQKKALEEIKAAGIEELETCPFCDFATIPAAGYSIFSCLNPDCMKESCRFCKEPSHIPYKCDEIEKDEDVKARTFVENKMTEALLKKCWKCGIKFFKEEGCNKMTCSCGASMCYVCGKPVTDYKHFNGTGGDRFDLCPLYSDSNVLNKENVLKAAEEAKAEIGNKALKHDPTADVDKHYKERAAKFPQQQLLVQQQRQAEAFLNRMRNALDQLEHHHHHHRRHHHHPL